ncbi:hypothetical protein [Mesorhizobium sp. B2-8-3]|uniref:hypothetical protein n=1 Tax=Mesorhizobium sp. B2-8-3 TaxID=2589905 RepID=UPI001129B4CF|nr:hypothetical protein [Mesorhizobium sp. B2-8-3]TPJ21310.1 hypothetical protein FJ418_31755 [Mesorhizobium sp. B2-8-3]
MGRLTPLSEGIVGQSTMDWAFVKRLRDQGLGIAGSPIEPDSCYFEILVLSLRLKQPRCLATAFHGVVYSFSRLPEDVAEAATATSRVGWRV